MGQQPIHSHQPHQSHQLHNPSSQAKPPVTHQQFNPNNLNPNTLALIQQLPNGKIYRDPQTLLLYFFKEYTYTSEEAYQQAFIKYSTKLTQKHDNILNLLKTHTKVENTFCSTFFKITLIYEYIDYTLGNEIQMRNKENRKFQEKEIWSILFHCILALSHMKNVENCQHNEITVQNIRLSQDGLIKILPNELLGCVRAGDSGIGSGSMARSHHCDEECTKILGMTILSCLLMKSITNKSNEYLEALVDKIKCSKELKKILYLMVMDDETEFKELEEYLLKLASSNNGSNDQSGSSSHQSSLSSSNYCDDKKVSQYSNSIRQQEGGFNPQTSSIDYGIIPMAGLGGVTKSGQVSTPTIAGRSSIVKGREVFKQEPEPSAGKLGYEPCRILQHEAEDGGSDIGCSKNTEHRFEERENPDENDSENSPSANDVEEYPQQQVQQADEVTSVLAEKKNYQNVDQRQLRANGKSSQNDMSKKVVTSSQNPSVNPTPKSGMKSGQRLIQSIQGSSDGTAQDGQSYNAFSRGVQLGRRKQNLSNNKRISSITKLTRNQQNEQNINEPRVTCDNKDQKAPSSLSNLTATTTVNPIRIEKEAKCSQENTINNYQNQQNKSNIYTDPLWLNSIKQDLQHLQQQNFSKEVQSEQLKQKVAVKSQSKNIENDPIPTPKIEPQELINKGKGQSRNQQELEANKNPESTTTIAQSSKSDRIIDGESRPKRMKEQQCYGNIFDDFENSEGQQLSFKKTSKHSKKKEYKKDTVSTAKQNQNHKQRQGGKSTNFDSHSELQSVKNIKTEKNSSHNRAQEHRKQPSKQQSATSLEPLQYVEQTYQKGEYKGHKLNNLRHGFGTFYYREGGHYEGQWSYNKMNGNGCLFYPNDQKAYEGEWKNDQLHGYGVLYNEEVIELHGPFNYGDWTEVEQYWIRYEGLFDMDNKNGKGKWYLSNGEIFQGNFQDDMVDGEGMLSREDGSRVKGLWRKNKLVRLF